MRRPRPALLVLGMTLLLTGCGPKGVFEIGVHEVAQNFTLGAQHKPSPPAAPAAVPPGLNFESGSPGFLVPPIPFQNPVGSTPIPLPTALPVIKCPTGDPRQAVDPEATNSVSKPPKPGVYHYRQGGYYQLKGQPQVPYAPAIDLTIGTSYVGQILAGGQHDPSDGDIYWPQTEKSISPNGVVDSTITYLFQMIPDNRIRIYSITIDNSKGSTQFKPNQAYQPPDYILFPATLHTAWDDASVDPQNQIDYSDTGQVDGAKDRVDACGIPVDSWRVNISPTLPTTGGPPTKAQASFTFPAHNADSYNIDGWYDIATQYNGLLVAEHIVETAIDGSFVNTRDLTINSVVPDPAP